jgi:hypothetical protein
MMLEARRFTPVIARSANVVVDNLLIGLQPRKLAFNRIRRWIEKE